MARGAGGRGNVANSDNTELTAVDNISVFILPSVVNSVGQIGSRDRLGLHTSLLGNLLNQKWYKIKLSVKV